MKRFLFVIGLSAALYHSTSLSAHCQMPCGIYHDNMIYDQVDQYVETMYKGMTMLSNSKFNNAWDRNEFVRWVINKEKSSDDASQLILKYFLQQRIKPGEEDTADQVTSAHKLLFLLVQIKQNVDRKFINDFADEWDKFKLMFHVEGYQCQVELLKQRKIEREREEKLEKEQGPKPVETKKEGAQISDSHGDDHHHDHDEHYHAPAYL